MPNAPHEPISSSPRALTALKTHNLRPKIMSIQFGHDDAHLPSYSDAVTVRHSGNDNNVRTNIQDKIHDELLNLAIKFNSIQYQKLQQVQQGDEKVLNLIIPNVQNFLAEYSETTLPTATLILIPAGSVSPLALPADDDLRSPDDFGRVITVAPEKRKDENVWSGADMTERLASYLQPRSIDPPGGVPGPPKPSLAEAVPSKKKSAWWKKPTAGVAAPPLSDKIADLPKVTMVVKAEEVVFRTESDLGLYQTETVWGIVIRVHVNAGR